MILSLLLFFSVYSSIFYLSYTKDFQPVDFFEVKVQFINNTIVPLDDLLGDHVVLIANIASQCGLTNDGYEQLSRLQNLYLDRGLLVFGAPCNQFGKQEPGSNSDIIKFAKQKQASFQILEKMDVNGPNTHSLYRFLKGEFQDDCVDLDQNCKRLVEDGRCEETDSAYMVMNCAKACGFCESYKFGGDITWNFSYFLVSMGGEVVARFEPRTNLLSKEVLDIIEQQLNDLESINEGEDQENEEPKVEIKDEL